MQEWRQRENVGSSSRRTKRMCLQPVRGGICFALLLFPSVLPLASLDPTRSLTSPQTSATAVQPAHPIPPKLSFVRVFSSPDDVRSTHPVLDRTLDVIAGPSDAVAHPSALQSPSAVVTDSNHRVFVADTGAKAVHVFDFLRLKYARWEGSGDRLHTPVSLALDGHDNLYVVDQSDSTVLVYDAAGKFRRYLGKLRGGESYFSSPTGIAIDRATGHIFVSDRQAQMIFVMDKRGKPIRKLGSRGGGSQPGEFKSPTQVVVAGHELFVLDAGNTRIQVFDLSGRFLRAMSLGYADQHTGFAVDNDADIYVSDRALNQIQIFGPDGQPLYRFDPSSIKDENFGHPSAMWVDSNHLYVVDSQTQRVGLFQIGAGAAAH